MKRQSLSNGKHRKIDGDDEQIEKPSALKGFLIPVTKTGSPINEELNGSTPSPNIPESPMPDDNPGSFDRMDPPVSESAQEMLKKRGINSLFPIQVSTYSPIYYRKDVVGKAQTGSGKTISFTLPLMERLRAENERKGKNPRVICLSPTRELAIQIAEEFTQCSCGKFKVICVYGGVDIQGQINKLQSGVDVIVGTPGRVRDLFDRQFLKLDSIETIVLDEADEMLNIGFKEEVTQIMDFVHGSVPKESTVQTLLFSATMPAWVKEISEKYLRDDAEVIDVTVGNTQVPKNAKHLACRIFYQSKTQTIADLIRVYGRTGRTIVFCDTKAECTDCAIAINPIFECQQLHGDIQQKQREQTLNGFRENKFNVLVATDVAARGLDISGVDLIIMTHVPKDIPQYVHRAGRTARAGKEGTTITLFTRKELPQLQLIESRIKIHFQRIGTPQKAQIAEVTCGNLPEEIKEIPDATAELFRDISKKLLETGDAETVLCKVIASLSTVSNDDSDRSLLQGEPGVKTLFMETKGTTTGFSGTKFLLGKTLEPSEIDKLGEVYVYKDHFVFFDLPTKIANKLLKSKSKWSKAIVNITVPAYFPDDVGIGNSKDPNEERGRKGSGNDRRDGGERRRDGNDRRRDGNDRRRDGNDRRRDGGERRRDGGERRRDGGERRRDGGERRRDGGERRRDGNDRKKSENDKKDRKRYGNNKSDGNSSRKGHITF
ncbi:DEAD/DEAH box helicase domain containing protein [Entamoeba histolytica HM-1:IMSS-A]|uniref:DEAD/DEAH box helicase domain containing protein n=1 Tax=Entamoeba histolytica HM-1:IMSS-A TaxID=885318 RepID=N9UUF6_ENTH1|nr:DEAD/DEAH box helicase domain containing protein [Entamoeba histolytica HM-1:IMSS-A]